jgi:hypothetical protein
MNNTTTGCLIVDDWISCTERMPKDDNPCLIWFREGFAGVGIRSDANRNGWAVSVGDEDEDVSHWMPLPPPPKDANP